MKNLLLSGFLVAGSIAALAVPPKIHESGQPGASRTPIIARENPKAPSMPIPAYMKGALENLRERNSNKTPGKMLAAPGGDALDMYGFLWWSNNIANLPGIYIIEEDPAGRIIPDYGYDLYGYMRFNGWYLEYEDAFAGVNVNMDINEGSIYSYVYYTVSLSTGGLSTTDYPLNSIMFQK